MGFKINGIYKATNGKKFKCIAIENGTVTFAPMCGCVAYTKKAIKRGLRINPATKRNCTKINERGQFIWISA